MDLVLEEVDGGLGGVHPRVADGGAVVGGGKERGRVVLHAAVLVGRADGDERGQVLVLGPQPVGDPRAHRGPHEAVAARVHGENGPAVGGVGAVHRAHEAELVGDAGQVGQQLAHPVPRLPVPPELPGALEEVAGLVELHVGLGERQRLVVVADEQRLVLEQIVLRRAAVHVQEDDALGAGREVRRPGGQRDCPARPRRSSSQQRREGEPPEAAAAGPSACPGGSPAVPGSGDGASCYLRVRRARLSCLEPRALPAA